MGRTGEICIPWVGKPICILGQVLGPVPSEASHDPKPAFRLAAGTSDEIMDCGRSPATGIWYASAHKLASLKLVHFPVV